MISEILTLKSLSERKETILFSLYWLKKETALVFTKLHFALISNTLKLYISSAFTDCSLVFFIL